MNICLTGATGFIGSAVLGHRKTYRANVLTLVRKNSHSDLTENLLEVDFENLTNMTIEVLKNYDAVVHLAGMASSNEKSYASALDEFRQINRDLTLNLAELAAASGVKRFIFISSIKVNGNFSLEGKPFSTSSPCNPSDPYAISKYEAEKGLMEIAKNSNMEVIIIRPPIVYGPGVRGNFDKILKLVKAGIPLPFSNSDNKRSLLSVENLVDFIYLCADRNRSLNAANQIFLVSDGEDVSTRELMEKISKVFEIKLKLFPVPTLLLRAAIKLVGKDNKARSLLDNLQIDNSHACDKLGWKPKFSIEEQLNLMRSTKQL